MLTIDQLSPQQKAAVEKALDVGRKCVAITGPAGSGKTSLLSFIYNALQDNGYTPVVAAPTGRAAKRVAQATGIPAMTIHRLLEFSHPGERDPKTGKFYYESTPKRNRSNPLDFDTVIIDEYGMVNHQLHGDIVQAIPSGGRMIVFGDNKQLPPIEKDAAAAQQPPWFARLLDLYEGITLDRVFRQDEGSEILANAGRILQGVSPKNGETFKMYLTEQPLTKVLDLMDDGYIGLSKQVLTPSHVGWVGTHKLSNALQGIFFDADRKTIQLQRHEWDRNAVHVGVGDKIMFNQNWYALSKDDGSVGIFNGEMGHIIEITDYDEIIVDFGDGTTAVVPPIVPVTLKTGMIIEMCPHKDIYLGYAITTHKAQGCEYDEVTYVINTSMMGTLNRRNFYTAVTRAKHRVNFVTDMKSLSTSLFRKEPMQWTKKK